MSENPQIKSLGPAPFVQSSQGVRVSVWPELDARATKPELSIYLYNYTIEISNFGTESVQLLSRQWLIKDGFNNVEHVSGEGVVGKQPIIFPGESFVYSSSSPLRTPTGSMRGRYFMQSSGGRRFEVEIPEFELKDISLVN